jgi:Domain of unknown function (DUF4390)
MRTAAFLFPVLLVAFTSGARAEARIEGFVVAVEGTQVLASFRLEDGFSRKLSDRLESGLPTAIVYRLELQRDRKRWYDRQLAEASLEVVALYDAVTRETTVNFKLDDKLVESRMVRDRAAVAEAMTRIGPLPVFSLDGLVGRYRLLVRVRAELGSRMILSFIPSAITTDWADSRKFRLPAAPQ